MSLLGSVRFLMDAAWWKRDSGVSDKLTYHQIFYPEVGSEIWYQQTVAVGQAFCRQASHFGDLDHTADTCSISVGIESVDQTNKNLPEEYGWSSFLHLRIADAMWKAVHCFPIDVIIPTVNWVCSWKLHQRRRIQNLAFFGIKRYRQSLHFCDTGRSLLFPLRW